MCRKTGLENKRRCGWLEESDSGGLPVWARGRIATAACPKSLITPESEALVEEFLVRRRLGGIRLDDLTARQAEAFLILEKELETERGNGQHGTGHSFERVFEHRR